MEKLKLFTISIIIGVFIFVFPAFAQQTSNISQSFLAQIASTLELLTKQIAAIEVEVSNIQQKVEQVIPPPAVAPVQPSSPPQVPPPSSYVPVVLPPLSPSPLPAVTKPVKSVPDITSSQDITPQTKIQPISTSIPKSVSIFKFTDLSQEKESLFLKQLDRRVRSESVKRLQICLTELGFYNGPITSYFGILTQNGVKSFQRNKDIISYGNPITTGYGRVGKLTLAELNDACVFKTKESVVRDIIKQKVELPNGTIAEIVKSNSRTFVFINSGVQTGSFLSKSKLQSSVPSTARKFDQCTIPYFVDPKVNEGDNIQQVFADFAGNYIVWHEAPSLDLIRYPHKIQGYYLGPDGIFGTKDDMGPLELFRPTPFANGGGSRYLKVFPRVNKKGIVAFTRDRITDPKAGKFRTELVTCNFFNCKNTLKVIAKADAVKLGLIYVAPIQFSSHDLSDKKLVYVERDTPASPKSFNRLFEYDLISNKSKLLMKSAAVKSFLDLNFFFNTYVDDSGVVSWVRESIKIPVSGTHEVFINLPNTIKPLLVDKKSIRFLSPLYADLELSSVVSKKGQKIFIFYPARESSTSEYVDVAYKKYVNGTFSQPRRFISGDSVHQLRTRPAFNSLSTIPQIAFSEYVFNKKSKAFTLSRAKVMTYNEVSDTFSLNRTLQPSAGWSGPFVDEFNGFITLGEVETRLRVRPRVVTQFRAVIYDCRSSLGPRVSPFIPKPPSNLSAIIPKLTRVDLSWKDNSNNELGFKLEKSTDGISFIELAKLGADLTSYTDSNISPDTQYWYRIRAYNEFGNSAYSNTLKIRTSLPIFNPPSTPSNLTAKAVSPNQVNLSWRDNSTNESGFEIQRSLNNSLFSMIATTTANATQYSDRTVASKTTYWYRVQAFSDFNRSGFSNAAKVTTP